MAAEVDGPHARSRSLPTEGAHPALGRPGGGVDADAQAVEAHRRACEAREVLRWPLEQRREYLAAVERQRGKVAADILRAEIKAQHAARQKAAREIKQGWAE